MRKIAAILVVLAILSCFISCSNASAGHKIDDDDDTVSIIYTDNSKSNYTYSSENSIGAKPKSNQSESATQKSDTQKQTASEKAEKSDNKLPKDSNIVYRTPHGKRYHLDPDCGGKNSYTVDLQSALDSGLTPCLKCAK